MTKTSHSMTKSSSGGGVGGGGGMKPVNRELKFDSPSLVSSVRQRSRSPNYQTNVESQITRDVKYDTEPVLDTTPNSTMSRSYHNYSKSSARNVTPYNTEIVEMDTTDLPAELKDAPISSDLLPGPGTKVTTTVLYTSKHSIIIIIIIITLINLRYENKIDRFEELTAVFSVCLFLFFFLSRVPFSLFRLKLSHTKFRTIQKCQRTKISLTKMNSTIR